MRDLAIFKIDRTGAPALRHPSQLFDFKRTGFSIDRLNIECPGVAQRIEDIGAQKGIMVTTVGYQDGAIKLATSKGIALVVSETQEHWEHVVYCLGPGASKNPPPSAFKITTPSARPINVDIGLRIRGTSLGRSLFSIVNYAVDPTGEKGFNLEEIERQKRIKVIE